MIWRRLISIHISLGKIEENLTIHDEQNSSHRLNLSIGLKYRLSQRQGNNRVEGSLGIGSSTQLSKTFTPESFPQSSVVRKPAGRTQLALVYRPLRISQNFYAVVNHCKTPQVPDEFEGPWNVKRRMGDPCHDSTAVWCSLQPCNTISIHKRGYTYQRQEWRRKSSVPHIWIITPDLIPVFLLCRSRSSHRQRLSSAESDNICSLGITSECRNVRLMVKACKVDDCGEKIRLWSTGLSFVRGPLRICY